MELGPFEDKEKRTAFHRAVSSHHRLLNTRTINGGAQGQRINVAWVVKKGSKRRREEGEQRGRGRLAGECHFVQGLRVLAVR